VQPSKCHWYLRKNADRGKGSRLSGELEEKVFLTSNGKGREVDSTLGEERGVRRYERSKGLLSKKRGSSLKAGD